MTKTEILAVAKPLLFGTEMVQAILRGKKTRTMRVNKNPPYHLDGCREENIMEFSDGAWYCGTCGADAYGYMYGETPKHLIPKYRPCDYVYVRETWQRFFACEIPKDHPHGVLCELSESHEHDREDAYYCYRADGHLYHPETSKKCNWQPSIHMPKDAARLFLRVTGVKVQRPQELSGDEIKAEGIPVHYIPRGTVRCEETGKLITNSAPPQYDLAVMHENWRMLWDSTVLKCQLPRYGYAANPLCWVYELERVWPDD